MQLQERERKYPPPPIYKLTFSVTPTGAKVELKKNDANGDPVTGSDNVFSNLPPGNYYYSVSATGYDTQTGTVEITNKDVTHKIDLTLIVYTLTFNVTPSGSKVELKENDANGDPITGSDNVFSNLPPGNYYYSVSATGYVTQTGKVEVSNANVTKEISLEKFTFVHTLSMENPFGAYHWGYFETKATGEIAFDGKLYFLLKEKGNAKPSVDDMTRHPNRMNRVISVAQGTAKTVTKNFTGLSGDAVVNANYEFTESPPYFDDPTRLEGIGHVLAGGATYVVWVLPVADDNTPEAKNIRLLGEISTKRQESIKTKTNGVDADITNRLFTTSPNKLTIEIGPDERLMVPMATNVPVLPSNSIIANLKFEGTPISIVWLGYFNNGITTVQRDTTNSYTYSYGTTNNPPVSQTPTADNRKQDVPAEVFYSLLAPSANKVPPVERYLEQYAIISTEKITTTKNLEYIILSSGQLISTTKVP